MQDYIRPGECPRKHTHSGKFRNTNSSAHVSVLTAGVKLESPGERAINTVTSLAS